MGQHAPGTVLAGYRLEAVAGRGGMGVVYRAVQVALDRRVALKLIVPELAADEEFRRRFVRESRTAASIEHPHVVPVYEAGEADGALFISMRWIDGVDLRTLITREGQLEPRRVTRILAQIASALDAAHARGLVHRDVKPGNVLVAPHEGVDHAYLTDFGLTKQLGSASAVTRTGAFVGTLDYMAPEQIRGEAVDARSDVYALACVAFEMLSGVVPYERDSDVAKLWAHMNEPPPRLSELAPDLPKELDLALGRALSKTADDRHPSASDLARAVEAAIEGRRSTEPERSVATGEAAPATTRRGRGPAPTRVAGMQHGDGRRPWLVPALAGAAAAIAIGGAVLAATGALSDDDGGAAPAARAGPSIALTAIPIARPTNIAIADGRVWVTSYERDTIVAIDEQTGEIGEPIEAGDGPAGVAIDGESLFVSQTDAGRIGRIDIAQRTVVGNPIEVAGSDGDAVESGGGKLWVATPFEGRVTQIDAESGRVERTVEPPGGVSGDIALDESGLWVVGAEAATVVRVDPRSGEVGEPVAVGRRFEGEFQGEVAAADGAVWVASPDDETVTRVDAASGEAVATIRIPTAVGGDLAAGLGEVFVVDESGQLVRIDPDTNRIERRPAPAGTPDVQDVETGADAIWVASSQELDLVVKVEP